MSVKTLPDSHPANEGIDLDRLRRSQNIMDEVMARSRTTSMPTLTGFEDPDTKNLILALRRMRQSGVPTLAPILPLLLELKGRPYTIRDYFPLEPFFRTRMPRSVVLKCARQLSKSTSLAAQGVAFSASVPNFTTLYVTPLFEMVRRFSHNYVKTFIENSPARSILMNNKSMNSVLQRSFLNGSTMHFSYAFLDAERTRGIPGDGLSVDEGQDMNYDFLPILFETLSGSPWQRKQFAGTPKSMSNTMQKLWTDSSQAEWMTKCHHPACGKWNIPSLDYDLYEMIGPWHREISDSCPGVVCGSCRKPLNPRLGRWVHRYPDRRWSFAGYHVPQMIMPMHYADQEKWDTLVGKLAGRNNTSPTTFLNEVCGESCDSGAKLVTETDLRAASTLPWRREDVAAAAAARGKYVKRIVAVDWGGGGGVVTSGGAKKSGEQRTRTSFTSIAVLGMTPSGEIHVIWGCRSVRTHDYEYEARLVIEAMVTFGCSHIAHDYTGAGAGRLVLLYQSGIPPQNVVNISYQGPAKQNIMTYHPASDDNPNAWYGLDKSYSLVVTCMCIKQKLIRFFQYDYVAADKPGIINDFTALVEEKVDSRLGRDIYTIMRDPNAPDDFAQAVNMGCCTLWRMTNRWPNVAQAAKMRIPEELMKHIHPRRGVDLNDV